MNSFQVENNVQTLFQNFNKESFVYDFLLAYDTPKAIVKKLRDLALNLSEVEGELLWKKKLFFKEAEKRDLHLLIDGLKTEERITKYSPRFILITNYNTLLALDTKTRDSLDIAFTDLPKHFDFFLPLAGMEKAQFKSENPADIKAAEKMAKLYDEIKKNNKTDTSEEIHQLNVFLSRLLFCFFAEDTEIFGKGQFTTAIKSHTQVDGTDLQAYLERLFEILNTDKPVRKELPSYLNDFPYVNGGLFRDKLQIPVFNHRSRAVLIECGELSWKDINPDIFGSMIQAVITPEHRGGMGMHYTSVPNIMKVIEPLFLDELKEEFEAGKNQPRKLNELLYRLSKIKIFDPACGSGNFLIIAYKELRLLEIEIIQQLELLQQAVSGFEERQLALIPKAQQTLAAMYHKQLFSNIQLTQFYGIELDDFAHEIATLSLWLAQHQMNMKFKEVLGQGNPTLPLKESGHIVHGNATRLKWEEVCQKKEGDEIYVLGNPPYLGYSLQSKSQKEDMEIVFQDVAAFKTLDYIACWFYKTHLFIKGCNAKCGLVSTNSITQGEQVSILWPHIFRNNIEIGFAYSSFKWANVAKGNAGVTCVIIGLRNRSKTNKTIFSDSFTIETPNINPYLISGSTIFIEKRKNPLSAMLPSILRGSGPVDGGNLIFSNLEKDIFVQNYPYATAYLKKLTGAEELINNQERWCLWIESNDLEKALLIPEIRARLQKVKEFRLKSSKVATQKAACYPHRFAEDRYQNKESILIPSHSSEKREYIPIGYLSREFVITNSAQAIYDPDPWILGVVTSKMHMLWIRAVCGSLETRIRYSSALGYNTFPFPPISASQKQELEKHVYRILEEREMHPEKTLAQLYDPDKMPEGLREAHRQNDLAVERCYRSKPFESDEERLEYLFKLYEEMIAAEKKKGTLFGGEKNKRKEKSHG